MKVQVLAGLMACSLSVANAQVIFFDDFDAVATGVNGDDVEFVDGPLTNTPGFGGNSSSNVNAQVVDTTAGTLTLNPEPFFLTTNRFTAGGVNIQNGDTIRFTTELSVERSSHTNSGTGFYVGFRVGAGGTEFAPDNGIAHGIDYSAFEDGSLRIRPFSSGQQIPDPPFPGSIPQAVGIIDNATIGLGPALVGDTVSDFFRLTTEATLIDVNTGEFEVVTFADDLMGNRIVTVGDNQGVNTFTVFDPELATATNPGDIVFGVRNAFNTFDRIVINSISAEFVVDDVAVEGDLNGDGSVTGADYTLVRDLFGTADATADITGATAGSGPDGTVDVNDLAVVTSNFGAPAATVGLSSSVVPEPTSLALIMTFGVAALRRNRK